MIFCQDGIFLIRYAYSFVPTIDIFLTAFFSAGFGAFVASLGIGVFILFTKSWHGQFSFDHGSSLQAIHDSPVPRIGGIAIFLGVLGAYLYLTVRFQGPAPVPRDFSAVREVVNSYFLNKPPAELLSLLGVALLAGIPAFAFGFMEDLTKRVSVRARLLATMFSGALACLVTGYSLTSLGIPGDGLILNVYWISIVFTAFATGGVANAINIIDGLNGLASSTLIVAFWALATIAVSVGDIPVVWLCCIMGSAVFGFFLLNWPYGRIFLGDGGSYFCGFTLAWACVLLVERNHSVSPFACLLICILPITEVLFSVYRRWSRNTSPGMPDRLHLHSLLNRRVFQLMRLAVVSTRRNPRAGLIKGSSLAGLVIGLSNILPAFLAHFLYQSTVMCMVACFLCVFGYIVLYSRLVLSRWGWLTLMTLPKSTRSFHRNR